MFSVSPVNSCHEEDVRDRIQAKIEAADPGPGSAASIPARIRSQTPYFVFDATGVDEMERK
eukprot:gene19533-biopygen784